MNTKLGIDVSGYQLGPNGAHPDWRRVAQAGVSLVIVKATEGATHWSPPRRAFAEGTLAAGMALSYYHYAWPGPDDPEKEATFFCDELAKLPPPTPIRLVGMKEAMPVVWLDLEEDQEKQGPKLTNQQLGKWAERFVAHVEKPDLVCGVYANRSYLRKLRHSKTLGRVPLWIADPSATTSARVPPESPWKDWAVWQYSTKGRVDGIHGDVDVNRVRLHTRSRLEVIAAMARLRLMQWIKGGAHGR
jgi:GH25 family lysozyme M1 (1,4-beta-N-acetylmuramidase)